MMARTWCGWIIAATAALASVGCACENFMCGDCGGPGLYGNGTDPVNNCGLFGGRRYRRPEPPRVPRGIECDEYDSCATGCPHGSDCGEAYMCDAGDPCANGSPWAVMRRRITCGSGCGEFYWNEWINDPPTRCEPCDMDGHYIGPRSNCCKPRYFFRNGWRFLWGYRADRPGDCECFQGRPCHDRVATGSCDCGHDHGSGHGYREYGDDGYEAMEHGTMIEEDTEVHPQPATRSSTSSRSTTAPRRSLRPEYLEQYEDIQVFEESGAIERSAPRTQRNVAPDEVPSPEDVPTAKHDRKLRTVMKRGAQK